ncbi:MAG: hypothetical protein ACYDEI_06520 [Erysipelotrichaceae bacterium]
MRTKYIVLIMSIYLLLLVFGLIYQIDIILQFSTALAVLSSGFMQYSESKKTQDEREMFINERAQSKAFLIVMGIILLSYIGSDSFRFLSNFEPALILEILFGIGFMSYSTMYIYLSRKY